MKEEVMGKLDGKIILITGGTSGIGAAAAELAADEGAQVIVLAHNEQRGYEFEKTVKEQSLNVSFLPCNVGRKDEVIHAHRVINEKFGKIDILVNNAGILKTGALEEITDEEWDEVYQINVKGVLYMCQEFIEDLSATQGVILNVASINGLFSYIKGKRSYMYSTSKAALIQLTRYLAKNYAPQVRVNCLCPGITETNLFINRDFSRFEGCNLLNRIALPEEIAKAALFLVSDDSSFMTGSIVVVDSGDSIKFP